MQAFCHKFLFFETITDLIVNSNKSAKEICPVSTSRTSIQKSLLSYVYFIIIKISESFKKYCSWILSFQNAFLLAFSWLWIGFKFMFPKIAQTHYSWSWHIYDIWWNARWKRKNIMGNIGLFCCFKESHKVCYRR